METKELRVDRMENGLAVAYDREGREYCMCGKLGDFSECDVLVAKIGDGGEVMDVTVKKEETERLKSSLSGRLAQLFGNQEEE